MKKASDELVRLNNLMLHAMEHNGWIELNRDNSGNIKGFTQRIDFNTQ